MGSHDLGPKLCDSASLSPGRGACQTPSSGRQPCRCRIETTALGTPAPSTPVENPPPRPKSPLSRTYRQRDRRIGRLALSSPKRGRAFELALAGSSPAPVPGVSPRQGASDSAMTQMTTRVQDIDRHVGARIRESRIMLGLTQQQLADLIGVTYQQAHKYERGINRVSAGRLFQIARALGVPHRNGCADSFRCHRSDARRRACRHLARPRRQGRAFPAQRIAQCNQSARLTGSSLIRGQPPRLRLCYQW